MRAMSLDAASVIAFAPSTDLVRSRKYYESVLGLPVLEDDQYACVFQSGGTMLRVTLVGELNPAPFTVLGWGVQDIRKSIADLTARGVAFLRFDDMSGQDADGILTTPNGDLIAWFRDPDGNMLSLTEFA
jgi:catechol 2,3-dioxygenase-like lactoylglutathione lyase family enzyme